MYFWVMSCRANHITQSNWISVCVTIIYTVYIYIYVMHAYDWGKEAKDVFLGPFPSRQFSTWSWDLWRSSSTASQLAKRKRLWFSHGWHEQHVILSGLDFRSWNLTGTELHPVFTKDMSCLAPVASLSQTSSWKKIHSHRSNTVYTLQMQNWGICCKFILQECHVSPFCQCLYRFKNRCLRKQNVLTIPRHCLVEAYDRCLLCRENPIDDPSTPACGIHLRMGKQWVRMKFGHHGRKSPLCVVKDIHTHYIDIYLCTLPFLASFHARGMPETTIHAWIKGHSDWFSLKIDQASVI